MATQRAAAAFLRYLSYSALSPVDRAQIEGGLLSLIAPPTPPGHTGHSGDGAAIGGATQPNAPKKRVRESMSG